MLSPRLILMVNVSRVERAEGGAGDGDPKGLHLGHANRAAAARASVRSRGAQVPGGPCTSWLWEPFLLALGFSHFKSRGPQQCLQASAGLRGSCL